MAVFARELEKRLSGDIAARMHLAEARADLDHSDFSYLALGESIEGEAVIMFLDMRRFTRLSMGLAHDPEQLAKIVNAVVGAASAMVLDYGAHINDFTGDGIMAVFGGQKGRLAEAHAQALYGVSHMMNEMTATLRTELFDVGVEDAVQVATGVVSGPVLWTRVGTEAASRIQAVGEVAPLAAKYVTSAETSGWETMVGGEIAKVIPNEFLTPVKSFDRTYNGKLMKRERWLFDTSGFSKRAENVASAKSLMRAPASGFQAITGVAQAKKRIGPGGQREHTVG